MSCSRLEHIAIAARSPEALADWYVKTLEFEVYTTFDNGPGQPKTYLLQLGGSGPWIEIFAGERERVQRERPLTEPGLVHLAILVSDFQAAVNRVLTGGARPEGDERSGPRGSRVRFYRDPEGNLFHLIWRPEPLQR